MGKLTEWVEEFDEAADAVRRMGEMPQGGNTEGAEPPSQWAIDAAIAFLNCLKGNGRIPSRIAPCVEGGVTMVWEPVDGDTERRYADVEFFNTEEIFMAVSDVKSPPAIYEIRPDDWQSAVDRLYNWLCANGYA